MAAQVRRELVLSRRLRVALLGINPRQVVFHNSEFQKEEQDTYQRRRYRVEVGFLDGMGVPKGVVEGAEAQSEVHEAILDVAKRTEGNRRGPSQCLMKQETNKEMGRLSVSVLSVCTCRHLDSYNFSVSVFQSLLYRYLDEFSYILFHLIRSLMSCHLTNIEGLER